MPVRALADPVEVLLELPGQPMLPDPGLTDDRDQARLALPPGGVEQVLDQAQLLVTAHERRFQRALATGAAAQGLDAERVPGLDRGRLALQQLLAGLLVRDGLVGRPPGGLPHQDRSGRRRALEARGGVDQVAGDHGLAGCPHGGGRFPGQDRGPQGQVGARVLHGAHGGHQVQGGADRAFGVVLVGDRHAPDGHDRITDELLHRSAVAGDDLVAGVEVAGQELAGLFRVSVFGEGRGPHQVREQDRYQPPLGGGRGWLAGAAGAAAGADPEQVRPAFDAELGAGHVLRSAGRAAGRPAASHIRRRTSFRAQPPCRSWDSSRGLLRVDRDGRPGAGRRPGCLPAGGAGVPCERGPETNWVVASPQACEERIGLLPGRRASGNRAPRYASNMSAMFAASRGHSTSMSRSTASRNLARPSSHRPSKTASRAAAKSTIAVLWRKPDARLNSSMDASASRSPMAAMAKSARFSPSGSSGSRLAAERADCRASGNPGGQGALRH